MTARTPKPQLAAISGSRSMGQEGLRLRPSPRLDRFLRASASRGLGPAEATRLALDRFFALDDAAALGWGTEGMRRRLTESARLTGFKHALPSEEAIRVRRLLMPVPVPTVDASTGLEVPLPGRLLTRIGERVPARALDASAVEEMVRWEIAATSTGRTMGEWALIVLAETTGR